MRKTTLKYLRLICTCIGVLLLINSMSENYSLVVKSKTQKNQYKGSDVNGVLKELRSQYIVEVKEELIIIIAEEPLTKKKEVVKKKEIKFTVTVSAYTLGRQSTGKSRGDKGYGITASGYDLRGTTLKSARVIAADTTLIPMGSKVRLTFKNDKYKRYNAIYTVRDSGGAIKNKKIDLFMGDYVGAYKDALNFGIAKAEVTILN